MADAGRDPAERICRHEPCTCPVDDTIDYCGPTCRQGIRGTRREPCKCGHAACEASDGEG